jgi:hypothetical protein
MILRRLSQPLKEQNWTAIWIEFVLLVAGVFLGIQVANWNEQRQSRAHERELLGRVRLEIQQNIASAQEKARFFDTVYASAERTHAFLGNDAPCAPDCWQRVVDVFYASQWRDLRPARDAFDELEQLGFPRDTRMKLALTSYYGLYESMVTITSQLPEFRTIVRSSIPPQAQLQLWRSCHRIEGTSELLAADCPAAMGEAESRELMQQLRAQSSVRPALTYWMSNVAIIRPALDLQIASAQAVLGSIDSKLGANP